MNVTIPSWLKPLLNIKFLGLIDLALGLFCLILHSVVLSRDRARDGAGVWCGLVFMVAGILALNLLRDRQSKQFRQLAVASCTLAIIFDIILLALTSAAFEEMRPISDAHSKGLLAGVLISSLVLLPVNILLFIAECISPSKDGSPVQPPV